MSEVKANNILRQANNSVVLEGVLKEKKIMDLKTRDGSKALSGSLTVVTGENSEHVIAVSYSSEFKKGDGKHPPEKNSAYAGIARIRDEYVSVADLMQQGKSYAEAMNGATKIRVTLGRLELNDYYADHGNGQLISTPRIASAYFHRVPDSEFKMRSPHFDVECFIDKMIPEVVNDEETGRLIMQVVIPAYKGNVYPMTFVTTKEAGAYISNNYEPHRTCRVYGEVINTVKTVETRKAGFIKEEVETQTTRVSELLVDNGDPSVYDEDDKRSFALADIQAAMRVRETEMLPNLKERSLNRAAASSPAGFASTPVIPSAEPFHY